MSKASVASRDLRVTFRAASAHPHIGKSTSPVGGSEMYLESRPSEALNVSNKILIKINWKCDREALQVS